MKRKLVKVKPRKNILVERKHATARRCQPTLDNNVTEDEIKKYVLLDEHHYLGYQGKNTKFDVAFI